jgi:hypothetical protein
MAHFSEIDENNIVIRMVVVPDEQEHRGQEFLANDLGLGGTWLRCSYNTRQGKHILGGTPFRKNLGAKGYTYDPIRDAFIPQKPLDTETHTWVLNEDTCWWVKVKK